MTQNKISNPLLINALRNGAKTFLSPEMVIRRASWGTLGMV